MSIYLDAHYGLFVWKRDVFTFFRDRIIEILTAEVDKYNKKIDSLVEGISQFEKLVQSEETYRTISEYESLLHNIRSTLISFEILLKYFTKGNWTARLPSYESPDIHRNVLRKIGEEIGLVFHRHGSDFVIGLPVKIKCPGQLSWLSQELTKEKYSEVKEKVKTRLRLIGILQDRNPSLKDLTKWVVKDYFLDGYLIENEIPTDLEEYLRIPQFKVSELDFFLDIEKYQQ